MAIHLREAAALDRLHDDDLLAVPADGLIGIVASAVGVAAGSKMVEVIGLDLHYLNLGMLGEQPVEVVCLAMP